MAYPYPTVDLPWPTPITACWPGDTAVHIKHPLRFHPLCRLPANEDDHYMFASGLADCDDCLELYASGPASNCTCTVARESHTEIATSQAIIHDSVLYDTGPAPYRRCFECGQSYLTPDDLRAAYRDTIVLLPEIDPLVIPEAEAIFFCQECLHDF